MNIFPNSGIRRRTPGEIRSSADLLPEEAPAAPKQGGFPEETKRTLIISLTDENIERYLTEPVPKLIEEAEALDDAYYNALPPSEELALMYGDPHGDKLFGRRDLLDKYRKRFIKENGLALYDVTDERQTGSRRY